MLAAHQLSPGFAHTSLQRRAIRSAEAALGACDRDWIPARLLPYRYDTIVPDLRSGACVLVVSHGTAGTG